MINNANGGWNSGYVNSGYSYSSGFSAGSYVQHHKPQPQPQPKGGELWCLPIQNFRIDGGTTNLYSQKVSIDWPEFRPQSPIFSGPSVKQDTTNLNGTPAANYNFDDCFAFGNGTKGMIDQLVPGFHGLNQVGYSSPHAYIDYGYGGMSTKW